MQATATAGFVQYVPPSLHDDKDAAKVRRPKPRTPGLRHVVRPINDHLWKGRPHHKLTIPKKGHGKGGRNNTGHITVRHRGGGHKRRIRILDWVRESQTEQYVERIEHDPNRSAHIALLNDTKTNQKTYIVAAEGMREGDTLQSFRQGVPQRILDSMGGVVDPGMLAARTAWRGNHLPLHMIPMGTPIYNIAIKKDGSGVFCRSAGTHAFIVGKGEDAVQRELVKMRANAGDSPEAELSQLQMEQLEKASQFVNVKLSSGEVRIIHKDACATVGVASNPNHHLRQLGKAGRSRWLGIRPTVRGLAMNAMDHPHGGGRGKSKGNVKPKSPWGQPVSILASELPGDSLLMPYRPSQGSRPGTSTSRPSMSQCHDPGCWGGKPSSTGSSVYIYLRM